jgi:hypothetical protein
MTAVTRLITTGRDATCRVRVDDKNNVIKKLNKYKEHTEQEQEALAAEALKKVMEDEGAGEKKSRRDRSGPVQGDGSVKGGQETKEDAAKKEKILSGRTFVQIMNGEILTKDLILNNLPFTFFIGFLLVVMIAWGYYGETVAKKEVQLEKELSELNSEFFTLTAEYNTQRGRRQIAERLAPMGIKESISSPKKIRVRKYIFE